MPLDTICPQLISCPWDSHLSLGISGAGSFWFLLSGSLVTFALAPLYMGNLSSPVSSPVSFPHSPRKHPQLILAETSFLYPQARIHRVCLFSTLPKSPGKSW